VSRRAFLSGAGAMIGLPLLEAMIPGAKRARGAVPATPKRLVFMTFGTGTPEHEYGRAGTLTPATTGSGYALTPILSPLADLQDDILVVTGLHNHIGDDTTVVLGDHRSENWGLLTAVNPSASYVVGASVDQVAANALAPYTPGLPSLFMNSVWEPNSYAEEGWVSWSGPTSPRTFILDSAEAFRQVFGDTTTDLTTVQRRLAERKSVLDHAKADADRLRARLGAVDRDRLDQYLDSVRSLEQRVAAAPMACGSAAPPTDPGLSDPTTRPERTRQMIDLLVLAFQCDRTRVCNFMLGETGMYTYYNWLPAPYNSYSFHDEISHGASVADPAERARRMDAYVAVSTWNVQQFGDLVRKLKATPEGDGSGSLLDNTLLVCTSEMSYGHGHYTDHLPVIVAGKGGGGVSPGRHLLVPEQPIANLWLSMLSAVGVEPPSFGNSTGKLNLG
jgi:hypothetical protein